MTNTAPPVPSQGVVQLAWRMPVSSAGAKKTAVPLGQNLVQAGVLSAEDLEKALQHRSKNNTKLGETLLEMGLVEEEMLVLFLSQQLNVQAVRLRSGLVDPAIVRILPRAKAEAFSALALFRVRDKLTVAMAEPTNLRQIDEIEQAHGIALLRQAWPDGGSSDSLST